MAHQGSFLDKYKSLNSWNKYNISGTRPKEVYVVNNGYSQQVDPLLNSHEVLRQAGPTHVYMPNGYVTQPNVTTQVTTEITHHPANTRTYSYPINVDDAPVRIVKPSDAVTQRQHVRVRYLEPPELPTPAPIIIKERQLTPPPPAPPILIRQHLPAPPTPPPLVIRERPPCPPELPSQPTIIEKVIPPPTPPPRQVIVERIPAPEKPREVIYEKWLPYKPVPERQVIVERGRTFEKQPAPKNVIIEYERPNVHVEKCVHDEGVTRADPATYRNYSSCGREEVRVVDHINDMPIPNVAPGCSVSVRRPCGGTCNQSNANAWASVARPVTAGNKPAIITASGSNLVNKGPVGPTSYNGPWNTTYRSSYNGKGFSTFRAN